MKRTILFLTAIGMSLASFAQSQIPNSDFEQWSLMASGKDSAAQWSSSNSVVMGTTVSLLKASPGHQGAGAAHLVTSPFGFVQYSTIGILVNGKATFSYGGGGGGANVAYESGGGTPVSFKPLSLKGYYKYETLTTSDQGLATVLLTRYNATLNKRDTVSLTTNSFPVTTGYTAFEINLPDLMPGIVPDTITTIFYASNPATLEPFSAWSDLYLDELTLTGGKPTGDFTTDILNGNTSSVITCTDHSTNAPTAWQWTITPSAGVVYQAGTTSTSANPKMKFGVAGDYTVKLRVSNAFGADSITKTNYIHITNGGTGIEDPELNYKRAMYPNPANDKLYLTMDYKGAAVHITGLDGKSVLHLGAVTSGSIDLAAVAEGMYFVRISKHGKAHMEKLIVRRH